MGSVVVTPTLAVGPLIEGSVYAATALEAVDLILDGKAVWVDDEETAEVVLRALDVTEAEIAWRMRRGE